MITLRKLEPEDLPFLYQWENDSTCWCNSDTHNPLSQQDLRDYINSTTGDLYRDGQLRLIIERERETVGCVDLFNLDIRNRRAALGIYIAASARRHGIATETMIKMEQYAFEFLKLRVIYCIVSEHNTASNMLFLHLGYSKSATLKAWTIEGDAIVWIKENRLNI